MTLSLLNCVFFRKQVQASRVEAEKDNVVVPTTMEEYCMKSKPLRPAQDSIEMDDFYDDDCYDMDDDDEEEEESESEEKDEKYDDAEDSGNGESWKWNKDHRHHRVCCPKLS